MVKKPYSQVNSINIINWDAVHYKFIKENGYNVDKAGGDYIFAFFPLFPFIWRILNLPSLGIIFLNYIFFAISLIILLKLFTDKNKFFHYLLISLCLPSIIIFFIPYSEATFLIVVSIGVYGFVKNKYWLFFIGFFLASITRPAYTILGLAIISTELIYFIKEKKIVTTLKNIIFRLMPLIFGMIAVIIIQYLQGSKSIFKFIEVQKYWDNTLKIPTRIADWSHEGFAINIGVIVLIFFPLVYSVIKDIIKSLRDKNNSIVITEKHNYLLVLSAIYIIGATLFILLFRGGSLHCLFRFTLCTPFAYILLFKAHEYIKISNKSKVIIFYSLAFICILLLSTIGYSRRWNFSDFGILLMISTAYLWLFQERYNYRFYKILLVIILYFNILWTTYLFNSYINNSWIFA